MPEQTLYTLWNEQPELDIDDEILASGLTLSQAAKFIREHHSYSAFFQEFEYDSFRCFELIHVRPKSENFARTQLGATVPKTADLDADRNAAMEMIDVQTCNRHQLFWDGQISTDTEFKKRSDRIEKRRAVRKLDREIATKLVDALLADGYTITCCLRDIDPKFEHSKARKRILKLLFDLEIAELHVHKENKTSWIMLVFGEEGWDCIGDYTEDLAYLIDPIIAPYLPWNQPNGNERDRGYSVFVLPSPEKLDRGEPGAERAFDEFVQAMERVR